MNMQILSNLVLYASVILLVSSILFLCISLITIRKKRREEFILNHRIILNEVKNLRNAAEVEKDAFTINSEVMKALIESASKHNDIKTEYNRVIKRRKRILRRRTTDSIYKRCSKIMMYYWLKKMELTNKRVENLNMSILECDLKIREAKADKIG